MKKTVAFILLLTVFIAATSFTLTAEAASDNLISDPSFEGSSLVSELKASNCGLELTTAQARTGNKSLKVKNRTANYGSFQYDMVNAVNEAGSGVYEFSCWVKIIIPQSVAKKTAKLYLLFTPAWTNDYVDGSGKLAGTNTYPYRAWYGGTKIDVANNTWTKLTIRTEIAKNNKLQILSSLQMYFTQDSAEYSSGHTNFEIYVDDCSLVKVSSIAENNGNKNLPAPAAPAKNDDGSVTHADGKVYVNDPNLAYTGRWNTEYNTVYYTGWQGYVDIKFTGTKTLKAMGKYDGTTIGSEVYVEIFDESGKSVLSPQNANLGEVGRYVYMTEGKDLTCGAVTLDASKTYTLRIVARWNYYRMLFQGVYMDAGAKTLPIADAPKIELIGDSITAGYIDGTYTKAAGISWTDSYSYRVGKLLGWQTSAVAKSGIAVADLGRELMPEFYDRFTHVDPTVANDFTKQDLDYIVINLGTNDSSYLKENANNRANYVSEYKKFVQHLLQVHPNATIFIMEPYCNINRDAGGAELKKIADELTRVEFIATADWNLHTNSSKASEYLTADKIHLLPAGADVAAQKLAAVLKAYHEGDKTPATQEPSITQAPQETAKPTATETPVADQDINEKNNGWVLWACIAGAVVVAAVAVVVVIVLKKKKAAAENAEEKAE